MRDNFTHKTIDTLAKRVGFLCSNPSCKCPTVGPTSGEKSQTIGVAAHITAASLGGPRYDAALSKNERKSIHNAIWLCQTCAKLIDNDLTIYTVMRLILWKNEAEISQFLEHNQTITSSTVIDNSKENAIKLFSALKKTQQLYDYFFNLYKAIFAGCRDFDDVTFQIAKYPSRYYDSIEKPSEQLVKTAAQANEIFLDCILYLEEEVKFLYEQYFLLDKFEYEDDSIGLYNTYLARFFENVCVNQDSRLAIVKEIEEKMRIIV